MKKFAIAGIVVASALTLSACGSGFDNGYAPDGTGWNSSDWDMNNPSIYNNNTYCQGGTYQPLAGNQYSCSRNGITSSPSVRPAPVIPPKTQQKAPVAPPKAPAQQPKQNTAPKAPSAPRPAAPAPRPPAPKTGK